MLVSFKDGGTSKLFNPSIMVNLLIKVIRLACGKFELTNQDSAGEEVYCPDVDVSWQEWHWNQVTFLTRDGIAFSRIKKGLTIPKPILDYKKWKIWNITLPPSF